jgi:hypothetical protein
VSTISTDHAFVRKHHEQILGVLSCFDRVIIRGHLPLSWAKGLEGFLYQQDVLLKDFGKYAPALADRIRGHVKSTVLAAGAPFRHLPSKEPMEEEARRLVRENHIGAGIVCGFSQLEVCRTFRLEWSDTLHRLHLRPDFRKCTVLYVFIMHAVLGLIHVKIQTWLPLTMQVYVNGHDILAKKLDQLGIKYCLQDNAFTWISDMRAAQRCADRFVKLKWPKLLGQLARQFNPLVGHELGQSDYYWVVDQAEHATDVLFRDASALAGLYPRLVEHARVCFTAADVLKFLGRKLIGGFQGEVRTHVGQRVEGVRIKHQMKSNKLKMYDKAGSVLRIETTINDPSEFRVWRKIGKAPMAWHPLPKGVAWLWRYAEVSRSANGRYLEALAVVDDDSAARKLLDRATRPATRPGLRRRRALQPLSPQDQQLFVAVMRGEHRLRGFRNGDLARLLYPGSAGNVGDRRRRCARVTRLIQLLRAHGLAAKIPRTRRYRITTAGERLMSAAIKVKEQHLPQAIHNAS